MRQLRFVEDVCLLMQLCRWNDFYLVLPVLLQRILNLLQKVQSLLHIFVVFIFLHPLIVYFLLYYVNACLLVLDLR